MAPDGESRPGLAFSGARLSIRCPEMSKIVRNYPDLSWL